MQTRTFLATTGRGLARAHFAAGEWTVQVLRLGQDVRCLAADPLRPEVVYAGTQGSGVLRSADGGQTWEPSGLDGQVVKAIAASPAQPGLIFAGIRPPAVVVSRDDGRTWTELESLRHKRAFWWFSPADPPDWRPYVQAIAPSPADPDVIVVGIELGAVLRTADGGRTWEGHCPGALRDCHTLAAHASDGRWMYEAGGSGAGAAVSQDGGRTWRQMREGLDRSYGWAVAADPARPAVWYASLSPMSTLKQPGVPAAHVDGYANAHIFRCVDGAPWQKLAGGLPVPLNYMAYALLTDPQAPGHVYAGLSDGQVWHSTDHGDHWQQLPFSLGKIQRSMILV